jgi:hypothetical protein
MLKELLVKFLKARRAKREADDEMFRAFALLSSFAGRIALAFRIYPIEHGFDEMKHYGPHVPDGDGRTAQRSVQPF